MPRSLIHYWRMNLAVILATAVATAVITGALLVGDSVRGSLRDLTLDRLGKTDYSVTAPQFFREDLADSLNQTAAFTLHAARAVPVITLRGSAVNAETHARASDVNIVGIDDRFNWLFGSDLSFDRQPGQIFQPALVNEALARELGVEPGHQILLSLQRASDIHRESLMGNRDPGDQIETSRLELTRILPNRGAGRFSLFPHQAEPLNVFVKLDVLQRSVEEEGRVNTLLIAGGGRNPGTREELQASLEETLTLTDLGLKLVPGAGFLSLQSDRFVLPEWTVGAASDAAAELSLAVEPTSTYLANRIATADSSVPYSTITAVDVVDAGPLPTLQLLDGSPAPRLSDDEMLLNQWAAADLGAKPGEEIHLSYYAVGPRDALRTRQATFKLRGIVAMKGMAVDKSLVPEFPGISDAADMSSWAPPFPVDLSLIRPEDEAYWDKYRASPKAFVALATGQGLWGNRFGDVTTLRVAPRGDDQEAAAALLARFETELRQRLPIQPTGFSLQSVKNSGLAAASGPTDFSGLFVSFSFFLVFSATLIVGLLFRLSVDRRAREIGLLLSVGYSRRRVLFRFLKEAVVLAFFGVLLGLAGAVAYAGFLMYALRTWWVEAVGTTFLALHVNPATLLTGGMIAFLVVLLFTVVATRKLFRLPKPLLLAGETLVEPALRSGRRQRILGGISILLALGLIGFSVSSAGSGGWSGGAAAAGFFGVGACLLAAGLFFFAAWCRDAGTVPLFVGGAGAFLAMAARNSARNPGRSVLSVALVSSACFVIVAVGANRLQPQRGGLPKDSGTGGFALVATSEIPILKDLSSPEARLDLGFSAAESSALQDARVFPLRVRPGDDTSCLNLYRPQKPRLLGVPKDLVERGGFTVEHSGPSVENPWTLLEGEIEPGVIPAFGDHESVQWILQLGLGQDMEIQDEAGDPLRLRLVGLIDNSIFQSELLISEENFLRHFPNLSGYGYFLVDAPESGKAAIGTALESGLAPFGFDATAADEKLASYQTVRATYISTFQTLGGLGLLLGTLGLAVILIRNVIERRGELATLRAFGFRRRALAGMVLAENAFLLILGISLGTVAALIAVAPNLAGGASQVPWSSLLATLAAIIGVGMLASAAAVRLALRIPMLPALKAE